MGSESEFVGVMDVSVYLEVLGGPGESKSFPMWMTSLAADQKKYVDGWGYLGKLSQRILLGNLFALVKQASRSTICSNLIAQLSWKTTSVNVLG